MKRSHEQIEGLLNQRPGTESLGEGFGERVAQEIAGVEPGAKPVAATVMPASVKGAIVLGLVCVISAGVWVSSSSSPVEEPLIVEGGAPERVEELPGGSIFEPFRDLGMQLANQSAQSDDGMFSEGRKLLDDAKRVGEAFVSVFPKDWTEMIWSPGASSSDSDALNG